MRLIIVAAVVLASVLFGTGIASADGSSPYHLQQVGWTCVNVPDNIPIPNFVQGVHCFPPPLFDRFRTKVVIMLVFDTHDLNAQEARVLGTEIAMPADRYHGQPCPQNSLEEFLTAPGLPLVRTCHHFDSTP